jgi:zinc protease
VTDGDITFASVHGVQILVKRIPGAEIAAMQLCIRGGARDWSAADAGIERLALQTAVSGGTSTLDKDAYFRKLAALGSDIGASTNPDFSTFGGGTLGTQWDATFDLLVDAFLHPAMPASEFDVEKQQQLAAIRREAESPDASLSLSINHVLFKGHPFDNRSIGSEESVSKITREAVIEHLTKLREAGRLVFVTVGDVNPEHVIAKVKAAFGDLPAGNYKETPFPTVSFDKPSLLVTERKLATNYIEAGFPAPNWQSPEFVQAMVTMDLLRSRLFEEVRTKRNLSYAPAAFFASSNSVPMGFLYVTAVDPNTTLKVMYDEVRKLQNEVVPEKDLAGTKATFLSRFLMQSESTSGQASMLANALVLGGDWKLVRTLPERIRGVSAANVQSFAKKYMGRMQTVVLGDPTKIDNTLFTSL